MEEREFSRSDADRRAERSAWDLTKEQVRNNAECTLHVAKVGVFCMKHGGTFYVCKARRLDAARKLAGAE